jgi:hypothetical protein
MLKKLISNKLKLTVLIVASCVLAGLPAAATVTQLFDFEDGTQGWIVAGDASTSLGYSSISPQWTLSTSMDGHTWFPVSTWWTNTNDGRLGAERSHVTSPVLTALDTSVSITFDSWSKNEGGYPTYYDVEHVQISINGGAFTDVHGYKPLQLHSYGDSTSRNITFTTPGITLGDKIQYRFLYDTGDGCCGPSGPGRGWAFDNVLVTGASEAIPVTLAQGQIVINTIPGHEDQDYARFTMTDITDLGDAARSEDPVDLVFTIESNDGIAYEFASEGAVNGKRLNLSPLQGKERIITCNLLKEECVIAINPYVDIDEDFLDNPLTICLEVNGTLYCNTGDWNEVVLPGRTLYKAP